MELTIEILKGRQTSQQVTNQPVFRWSNLEYIQTVFLFLCYYDVLVNIAMVASKIGTQVFSIEALLYETCMDRTLVAVLFNTFSLR